MVEWTGPLGSDEAASSTARPSAHSGRQLGCNASVIGVGWDDSRRDRLFETCIGCTGYWTEWVEPVILAGQRQTWRPTTLKSWPQNSYRVSETLEIRKLSRYSTG